MRRRVPISVVSKRIKAAIIRGGAKGFPVPQVVQSRRSSVVEQLIRKRKGTRERFEHWRRFERVMLRRIILRALRRISKEVAPSGTPVGTLERIVRPLLEAFRSLGLSDDPSCQRLARRQESKPPNFRRHYPLPWEQESDESAAA